MKGQNEKKKKKKKNNNNNNNKNKKKKKEFINFYCAIINVKIFNCFQNCF